MAYDTWQTCQVFDNHMVDYGHVVLGHVATVGHVVSNHVADCGHMDNNPHGPRVAMWPTCHVAQWRRGQRVHIANYTFHNNHICHAAHMLPLANDM
jgi:hypothetical protein